GVRYRNQRVVERRRDVDDADGDVLLFLLAESLLLPRSWCCRFCHKQFFSFQFSVFSWQPSANAENLKLKTENCGYFLPGAFFLATVARRGPLRVRAFVCVRWPRTGSPRRWRRPRYAPMSIKRLMSI